MDGKASNEDIHELLAVEARHRDVVTLMRMRLIGLWRAAQGDRDVFQLPTDDDRDHV